MTSDPLLTDEEIEHVFIVAVEHLTRTYAAMVVLDDDLKDPTHCTCLVFDGKQLSNRIKIITEDERKSWSLGLDDLDVLPLSDYLKNRLWEISNSSKKVSHSGSPTQIRSWFCEYGYHMIKELASMDAL